jgi:hypothetical protein
VGIGAQKKIDKAGAGDLNLGDLVRGWQRLDQQLGDLAWFPVCRLGQHQCEVGGEVAVLLGLGVVDRDRHAVVGGQRAGRLQALQGVMQQTFEVVFQGKTRRRESGPIIPAAGAGPNLKPALRGRRQ